MSDTHDHGPPNSDNDKTKSGLRKNTPFPQLARWSLRFSQSGAEAFSGGAAGLASGIVTCPLDVIKTKLQAQGAFRRLETQSGGAASRDIYRGLIGTARTIIRQDGLVGMYRGLGPMVLGYLPTWAVYMTVYDRGKHWFAGPDRSKFLSDAYASICAGGCATVATNPIWVIKTRLMSQVSRSASDGARTPWHYNSTLDAARKILKAEGIGAFYSGLAPALLGLTHVAIQFPLYEFCKQRFTGLEMGEAAEKNKGWGIFNWNTAGILGSTLISKTCASTATYPHEVLRTRLQTQQRHLHPEGGHDGVASMHHTQGVSTSRRVGNSDGSLYRPRYQGVLQTAKVILRDEGWRAFYNGMGTNMIRAVPAAMTTMLTYETVKGAIGHLQEEGRAMQAEEEKQASAPK